MTINDRFNTIIKDLYNGNKRAFATAIGAAPTVIENVVGARHGKPSYDLLYKICSNANISEEWLITGQGQMLKSSRLQGAASHASQRVVRPILKDKDKVTPIITQRSEPNNHPSETRPRIPFDASAGSLSMIIGSVSESDCEQIPIFPTLPRYDFTIFARGNSMEPQFMSGDELACRLINDKSFIQWGRPHVLDTAQGIVVKRIYDHGSCVTCKSNNPDYPDFDIPKEEIYRIALVVGSIHIE